MSGFPFELMPTDVEGALLARRLAKLEERARWHWCRMNALERLTRELQDQLGALRLQAWAALGLGLFVGALTAAVALNR